MVVGPEVAAEFAALGLSDHVLLRTGRRPTIDLAGAVEALLVQCGVPHGQIDRADLCTLELEREFFSYRPLLFQWLLFGVLNKILDGRNRKLFKT